MHHNYNSAIRTNGYISAKHCLSNKTTFVFIDAVINQTILFQAKLRTSKYEMSIFNSTIECRMVYLSAFVNQEQN